MTPIQFAKKKEKDLKSYVWVPIVMILKLGAGAVF